MKNRPKLPACYGTYEKGDKECEICFYDLLCLNFTKYLKTNKKEISLYLEPAYTFADGEYSHPKMGTKRFIEFCKKLKATKKRKYPPKYKPKRRIKESSYALSIAKRRERAVKRREKIEELLQWFQRRLIEISEGKFKLRTKGNVIYPGQIYFVDKREKTGYVTFRVRKIYGKDQPLVCLFPKWRTLTFDVLLPVGVVELRKKARPKDKEHFQFQPIKNGFFKSKTYGVDKRGLSNLAELLFNLSKRKIIDITPGGKE